MAEADYIGVQVQLDHNAINQAMERLGFLSNDVPKKTFVSAARKAIRVFIDKARAEAPVRTGALKKSLGVKVKAYSSSHVIYAIAGPRKGSTYDVSNSGRAKLHKGDRKGQLKPSKYIHLVEFGHQNRIGWKTKTVTRTPGKFFMTRSFETTSSQVVLKFIEEVKKGIDQACKGQKPTDEGAAA